MLGSSMIRPISISIAATALMAAGAALVLNIATYVKPAWMALSLPSWQRHTSTVAWFIGPAAIALCAILLLLFGPRRPEIGGRAGRWMHVIWGLLLLYVGINCVFLSSSESVRHVGTHWEVGGRFVRWHHVSDAGATQVLWGSLRFYSGVVLLESFVCAMILLRLAGRRSPEP